MGYSNHVFLFLYLRSREDTVPSKTAYDLAIHLSFVEIRVEDITNPSSNKAKGLEDRPFQRGINIYLGRTYNRLCPVEAILVYLAGRQSKKSFLFKLKDGHLTKSNFVISVQQSPEKPKRKLQFLLTTVCLCNHSIPYD